MFLRVQSFCKYIAIGLISLFCLFLFLYTSVYASGHHHIGKDSVDDGEIRYNDNTRFDIARSHAIDVWNEVGSTDLKPDTFSTIADLNFQDFVDCSLSHYAAWWSTLPGADPISINLCGPLGAEESGSRLEKGVLAHEVGHAYGIKDHYNQEYYYPYILMYYRMNLNPSVISPTWHDIEDYDELWD